MSFGAHIFSIVVEFLGFCRISLSLSNSLSQSLQHEQIGPASRSEEVISHSLSHLQFFLGFQFQFHCFYKLDSNLFLNFCCFCKQIYGQEALEYVPITLHECSALYFFLLFIYLRFCSFSLFDL